MVRIRLRRTGGKGQPTYRIVAADKEKSRDGRFLEILGDYNPRTEPATVRVKEDRIYYWLSVGAQPSDAALQVFNLIGVMDRYERHKEGEDLEILLAESKEAQQERNIDPRTRRDGVAKRVAAPKAKEAVAEKEAKEKVVEEEAKEEVPGEEAVAEEEAEEKVEETPGKEAVAEEEAEEEVEEAPGEEAAAEEEAETKEE